MKIVPSSGEPRSAPDEDGFSSKIRRLWLEPRVKRSVLSKPICLDRFEIDGLSLLDQLVREVGRGLAVCDHRGHQTGLPIDPVLPPDLKMAPSSHHILVSRPLHPHTTGPYLPVNWE